MSAVGNYVHYKANNYLTYGTNKKGSKKAKENPLAYIKRVRNDMQSKINSKSTSSRLVDIETEYNIYRDALINGTEVNDRELMQILLKLLGEKHELNSESFRIDSDTGTLDLSNIQGYGKKARQLKKELTTPKGKVAMSRTGTVMKRLEDAFEQLKKWDLGSQKEKKTIENALEEIKKSIYETVGIVNKEINELNLESNEKIIPQLTTKINLTREQARNFISKINKAMAAVRFKGITTLKGDFEEYLAIAIDLQQKGIALTTANNALEEAFKKSINTLSGGRRNETIVPNFTSINKHIANELADAGNYVFRHKIVDDAGKEQYTYEYKVSSSQQKMDAAFTFEGKPYGLSIKNYNLKSGYPIGLVSGAPLLNFLIGYEDNPIEYANHFLNILAYHPDASGSTWNQLRREANYTLAVHMLYSALSGRWTGKKDGFAEILVVKDSSSKGGVKMYDVSSLVKKISKNSLDLFNLIEISPSEEFTTLEINNTWRNANGNRKAAISERLTEVLADAHRKKISLSIPTSYLT